MAPEHPTEALPVRESILTHPYCRLVAIRLIGDPEIRPFLDGHYLTSNGMNIDAKPKKQANPTTSVTVVRKIDED